MWTAQNNLRMLANPARFCRPMLTTHHLILFLQVCVPEDLTARRALYLLMVLVELYPLLQLHHAQLAHAHQPQEMGWLTAIWVLVYTAFYPETFDANSWEGEGPGEASAAHVYHHLENVCQFLDIDTTHGHTQSFLFEDKEVCLDMSDGEQSE
jgi:hypothetical protein